MYGDNEPHPPGINGVSITTCRPTSETAAREPDGPPTQSTGSRTPLRRVAATAAEEREPGSTPDPVQDVCSDARLERPGSRVRFVAERASGNNGTVYVGKQAAYNKFDWEIMDRDRLPGRQLIARTDQAGARLIAFALNQALPR